VVLGPFTGLGAFHSHKFFRTREPQRENACGFLLEIKMTDPKVLIDVLVAETIALTKSISDQSSSPHIKVEPAPISSVKLRDELRERVSNFKAHQERFTREREDYAASQIKRLQERP
jgi:hypothetical protein